MKMIILQRMYSAVVGFVISRGQITKRFSASRKYLFSSDLTQTSVAVTLTV